MEIIQVKYKLLKDALDQLNAAQQDKFVLTTQNVIDELEVVLLKADVSDALNADVDYWKQRCSLAEKCLEESPCDPDVTSEQIKAWDAYHKFLGKAGNKH